MYADCSDEVSCQFPHTFGCDELQVAGVYRDRQQVGGELALDFLLDMGPGLGCFGYGTGGTASS